MAPKIGNEDSEMCRAVLGAVLKAIEGEALIGASPMDIAHALTFILCIYKFKFGWSTEQMLSLYELYITRMEKALEDPPPSPYGEA